MNAAMTALRPGDLAPYPVLTELRWGAGEDPMSKAVWYTAADTARGLVLVLCAPCSESWLGAPHGWSWTIYDRAGSRPGPGAESSSGHRTASEAAADLAEAYTRLASERWSVLSGA